jgi:hypothetical protein
MDQDFPSDYLKAERRRLEMPGVLGPAGKKVVNFDPPTD